ncbi:MAG: peptidoglycan editing factor PgeF [Clostridia bacterium]|nr:peptidoglycan editing factor PgeF [Clostridia bacterium]
MRTLKIDDRVYFKSEILDKVSGVSHAFTSRLGGYSRGKIEGLNLGFRVGDSTDAVVKNYNQVSDDLGFKFENITAAKQIHSDDIRVVTEEEKGCGVARLDNTFEADGLITNCKNIPITVFYADCVPILLCESDAGVIAAIHSGWRGTVLQIVGKAVEMMCKEFGADPKKIKVAIGPSIGKCCFETGAEVAAQFNNSLVTEEENGKFKVDLWEANRQILLAEGVKPANIDILKLCTICHSDVLYSYRTHGENTGRMGAFIMLEDERRKL